MRRSTYNACVSLSNCKTQPGEDDSLSHFRDNLAELSQSEP